MILSAKPFGFQNRSSRPPGICTKRCSPVRLVILGMPAPFAGWEADVFAAKEIVPWCIHGGIALVGRGDPPRDDGASVFVDVDVLRITANHQLITQGVVYPTYYRALFPDLRNELTVAANQARDSGLGVWPSHETTTGFDVTGLDALQDDIVILPKLFRRLVDYLHLGDDSMPGLPAFLDQAADKFFTVHRALDHRAGRDRGNHGQQRENDPPNRRPRLRREMMVPLATEV
jgi:hypothetical protein